MQKYPVLFNPCKLPGHVHFLLVLRYRPLVHVDDFYNVVVFVAVVVVVVIVEVIVALFFVIVVGFFLFFFLFLFFAINCVGCYLRKHMSQDVARHGSQGTSRRQLYQTRFFWKRKCLRRNTHKTKTNKDPRPKGEIYCGETVIWPSNYDTKKQNNYVQNVLDVLKQKAQNYKKNPNAWTKATRSLKNAWNNMKQRHLSRWDRRRFVFPSSLTDKWKQKSWKENTHLRCTCANGVNQIGIIQNDFTIKKSTNIHDEKNIWPGS